MRTHLVALCLAAALPTAQAQSQRPGVEERLREALAQFPQADENGDGELTREEWASFSTQRIFKRYPQADRNRDGVLTREEATAFMQARRDRIAEREKQNRPPAPTVADVKYGEHPQQAFDLWLVEKAEASKPTALCIYIHGGGFQGGDKSGVTSDSIKRMRDAGISFASMNYRLTNGGEFPYPTAMQDAARGLQLIRSRADEWNIDPEKIVCYGGSAGAGISLWLAFHDDLADPASSDPIARQSTRIMAAGTLAGQSTYDLRTYREWFGVPDLPQHSALPAFYAMQDGETCDSPRVARLAEDASPINHLSPDDPPVFMAYSVKNVPVTRETNQSTWVHHPLLGLKLQEAMTEIGLECVVTGPDLPDDRYEDIYDFLIRKLNGGDALSR